MMPKAISRRTARNAAAATLAGALACFGDAALGQSTSTTSGTLIVTGTVQIVSGISPSKVSGTVSVRLLAGSVGDINQRYITAPVTLTWNGNSGSGTVTLPYNWTYDDGTFLGSITISFEVSASLPSEPSAETDATISIPSSGSQTTQILPTSI